MSKLPMRIAVFISLAVICAAAAWGIWGRGRAGLNRPSALLSRLPRAQPAAKAANIALAPAAAAKTNSAESAAGQILRGEVIYDARAALPAQAALDIKLNEIEADGRSGRIIAQTHKPLSGRSPLDWSLPIKLSALNERKSYVMQAKISSGDSLLFVNAAPTAIDSHRAAYIIRLAKIDSSIAPAETHSLTGTDWQAISLMNKNTGANAEISLSFDGPGKADPASPVKTYQVSGSSGCNHYMATAALNENAKSLQFSPLGTPLIACARAAATEEAQFIALMAKVRSYKIDESGMLLLLDGERNTLARFIAH